RKRRTVKSDGDRRPHHLEQNLYSPGSVEPFERPDKIGKRAGQDPNLLPLRKTVIESCPIALGTLDQCLHDTIGDRDWPAVSGGVEIRNPNRAAHRQPAIAIKIQDDE